MNDTAFFQEQLSLTASQFAWAAEQIPTGRQNVMPLPVFGEWSAARIVFHMMWQEATIVLPTLREWTNGKVLTVDFNHEDRLWWQEKHDVAVMLARFRENRAEMSAVIDTMSPEVWNTPKETVMGNASPHWLVARTIQHTFEHLDTLLKMHLYWDAILLDLKEKRRSIGESQGSYDPDSERER